MQRLGFTKCESYLITIKCDITCVITEYYSYTITKCGKCYYKVRRLSQSATEHTFLQIDQLGC